MSNQPLALEEHEAVAAVIRRFSHDFQLFGRYPKSRIDWLCRQLDKTLGQLRAELDADFIMQFGHLNLYVTSPYYSGSQGECLPEKTL
jgi:hypothetical protein